MDEKEERELKKENDIIMSAAKVAGWIMDCQILELQKKLNEAEIRLLDAENKIDNYKIKFRCSIFIIIILLVYLFFIW